MKVIKEPKKFKKEIVCEPYDDGSGAIWGRREDYCGATLEIEREDICYREYDRDWGGPKIKDYGVICPCCNSFIQLPDKEVPTYIKNTAKSFKELKK